MRIRPKCATAAMTMAATIGKRHEGRLEGHEREQPVRRAAARLRQKQDGQALPDEAHAERHDDRGQVAQVDQRAEQRHRRRSSRAGSATPSSGASRSQVAVTQPTKPTKVPIDRSRSLPVMTNIWAMRRQRDRDRQVEHQVEAEIADGARVEPGDGDQHQRQRKRRQQRAQQARACRLRRCSGGRRALRAEADVIARLPPGTRTG